jgi:thiamine kinase-like enzyme
MLHTILSRYGFDEANCRIAPFGSGLINNTWKITCSSRSYILQRINNNVFKQPGDIATNIRLISNHFQEHFPDYLFISPILTNDRKEMVVDGNHGYFRLFPFVENSHTVDIVETPAEAFEAAKQFGRFTKLLTELDIEKLKITLPDFHNLTLRYDQYQRAVKEGNKDRIAKSSNAITFLQEQFNIVEEFEAIKENGAFKLRVTHHDTKISNILFDDHNKGLCVIDLDTVMPGYFISDVGDMMRTYLSPVSEEEKDFSKIHVREEYFKAIVDGYLSEMREELSKDEKGYFVYAGKFLIYMQALRFIADYLNNDIYYGATYPDQNWVRANNQIVLLKQLLSKEDKLNSLVSDQQ